MTVKVFVWLPRGGDVGHTSLEIDEDVYISFWPDKSRKTFAASILLHMDVNVERKPLYQDYQFDLNKLGFEPTVIELEHLQESQIRDYWQKIQESKLSWRLAEFNCATIIANALYIGSEIQPNFRPLADLDLYLGMGLPIGEVEAWEPKTILQYAKQIKKMNAQQT